jgi:hypothetical protein
VRDLSKKKNPGVIAAVDCTLVRVFKLSTSSMKSLTQKFGLIESFGSILVIEPTENLFPEQKGDPKLQTF